MTVWEKLGIDPTTNLRNIKKAYAKKLKLIDQESHPEKFIELREIFEEAQREAEYLIHESEYQDHEEEKEFGSNQNEMNSSSLQSNDDSIIENSQELHDTGHNLSDINLYLETVDIQFENLNNNITHQNIHLDIKQSISEFVQLLAPLEDQIKALYLKKMTLILEQNDLDDFVPQVLGQSFEIPFKSEISLENDHNFKESFGSENTSAPENFSDRSIQDNVHMDEEDRNYQQSDVQEFILLEEVVQLLWEDNVSDTTYEKFEFLLTQQLEMSLGTQIEIKDRLVAPLAQVACEITDRHYFRFLELWSNIYPDDSKDYDQSYYAVILQERINSFFEMKEIFNLWSKDKMIYLEQLSGKKKYQPMQMIRLHKELSKNNSQYNILQIIDKLGLKDTEQNSNYLFFRILSHWVFFSAMILIILTCAYRLFLHFAGEVDFDTKFYFLGFTTLLLAVYFYIFQAPILSWIANREAKSDFIYQYSLYWFISGALLCGLVNLIWSDLHFILSSLWLLSSVPLLSYSYIMNGINVQYLFENIFIYFDKWMITLGLMCFLGAVTFPFWYVGFNYQQQYTWLVIYSVIPLSLFFFPQVFKPLLFTFGSRKEHGEEIDEAFPYKSILGLILRIVWIPGLAYYFLTSSQPYAYLMSFVILCLALTIIPQIKHLSSIVK